MLKFGLAIILMIMHLPINALELQEALVSAYKTNDSLQIIRRDFLNHIEQFPQAIAGFLPNAYASVTSQNLKQKSQSRFPTTKTAEYNNFANNLTVEQPLFNGGRDVAGLKAAQAVFKAARGAYYASEQQILLQIIQSYLDYMEAQQKYEISEVSFHTNQKQLDAVQERLNVGESTKTELASARAGVASALTTKLTAYAMLQQAKGNFIRMFGIDPVDLAMPSLPDNLPASLDELLSKSSVSSPDIDTLKSKINASKANETVAKSALLPQVKLSLQSGKGLYNPESSLNTNYSSVTSAIGVTIPIYSNGGVEYSKIRQAKNATRKTVSQLNDQLKQNNAQCIASWEGFNAAKAKIEAASQGVEAAQIAYDGTIEEEKVGSKSMLDVLNAEENLNKAKISRVEATKACILAAYQMKSLIGQLTAKSLKLKVDYFDPEKEFKKTKGKIIGF